MSSRGAHFAPPRELCREAAARSLSVARSRGFRLSPSTMPPNRLPGARPRLGLPRMPLLAMTLAASSVKPCSSFLCGVIPHALRPFVRAMLAREFESFSPRTSRMPEPGSRLMRAARSEPTAHARGPSWQGGARRQLESTRSQRNELISRSDLDTGCPGRPPRPARRRNADLKNSTASAPSVASALAAAWSRVEGKDGERAGEGGRGRARSGQGGETAGDGGWRRETAAERVSVVCWLGAHACARARARVLWCLRRLPVTCLCILRLGYVHTVPPGHLGPAGPAQSATGGCAERRGGSEKGEI